MLYLFHCLPDLLTLLFTYIPSYWHSYLLVFTYLPALLTCLFYLLTWPSYLLIFTYLPALHTCPFYLLTWCPTYPLTYSSVKHSSYLPNCPLLVLLNTCLCLPNCFSFSAYLFPDLPEYSPTYVLVHYLSYLVIAVTFTCLPCFLTSLLPIFLPIIT